jgi:hypothetical protein
MKADGVQGSGEGIGNHGLWMAVNPEIPKFYRI